MMVPHFFKFPGYGTIEVRTPSAKVFAAGRGDDAPLPILKQPPSLSGHAGHAIPVM